MRGKRVLATICALALGVTPVGGAGVVLTRAEEPTPTAWWKMDETEGATAADAVGGANATVQGGSWSSGAVGGALDLNGYGDYAILSDYPKPATTATYSAWVFMREHAAHEAIIKNWDGETYGQLELGLNNTSGKLWAQVAQANGAQVSVTDSEVFPLNAWTLVTVTMDGSKVTLYKNGTAVGSCDYNGTLKTDFAPLGIGTKPNGDGTAPDKDWPCYLDGKIDDVRVYDVALSAEQIAALHEAALPQSLAVETTGKTTYAYGDVWDGTEWTFTVSYADGQTRTIAGTDCAAVDFDGTKEGEQTVTLAYTVGAVTLTAQAAVTVQEKAPDGGEEGEQLDLTLPLAVREATEWTRMFDRRSGWVGSDGIFSFNLDGTEAIGSATADTKTFFIFSDTLAGTVNPADLTISSYGAMMNHSAGLLTGDEPGFDDIEFYYGSKGDMTCTNIFGDNYWLMDGVVIGEYVYVVAIRVGGDWRVKSLDLVKIPIVEDEDGGKTVDLQNFTIIEDMPILHWKGEYSVVFGNGIMPNTVEAGVPEEMADGYIYVYGYRMDTAYHSELLVSRVLPENFENGKKWQFWNGSKWVNSVAQINNEAAVIMPNPVSNEASVTPITSGIYAGKYMAVYCRSGQNRTMEYAIADTPTGPFSEGVAFYDAPDAEDYPYRTYSYNAKAHPHLSDEGKLLVTYNVNNPDIWSQTNQLYRSRWVEIDLNTLAAQPVLGDVSSHMPTSASGYMDNDSAPRFGADGGYWQRSWKDDTPGDKWLQIDLGKVKYVRRYILRNAGWGDGKASAKNTRDWQFQVSLDGETWTTVDAVSGNTADKVVRDFDEAPARYVRIYITNPSQDGSDMATVTSIEVYGTPISVPKDTRVNVARGQKVTVSGGADTAAMLVNGQWDSVRDRWIDTTRGDKWAVVDLGRPCEISKYVVRHAGVREETRFNTNAFIIQASDDGKTWRDIDRVDYNMHNVTEREVTPFTARYVRLYITKATLSNVDVARIYSFELYSSLAADESWWWLEEIPDVNVVAGTSPEALGLPATVRAVYSNESVKDFAVTWDTIALDLDRVGTYTVTGTYGDGQTCSVTVRVRGNYAIPDIAWWRLDESDGTTAADATGNGADAALMGGAAWTAAKHGNGLSFARGFVLVKDYQKPITTATYSAWVYMNEYTSYATVIKNWGMDKHGQISLGLLESGGQMAVTFTQANGSTASVTDPNDFPLKEWTLVTAVADGENIRLYINDKEVGRAPYDGTLKADGYDPLGLGAKPNDAGNGVAFSSQGYLNGMVDDVRVYGWDLTAEDVAKLYTTEPYEEEPIDYGDVNRDGAVNTTDARLVLQYAVGKIGETALDLSAADVSGDGTVNTTDARLVLQYAVGKIPAFPVAAMV